MDLNVQELGTTLALGAFLLLGLGLVIDLARPGSVLRYLQSDHIPNSVFAAFFMAIVIIVGMLFEDYSNLAVDKLSLILPSEKSLRSETLLTTSLRSRYLNDPDLIQSLREAHVPEEMLEQLKEEPEEPDTKSVDEIYYLAKNRVFLIDNYYSELRGHQSRVDFARAFSVACLFLCLVSSVLLVASWFGRNSTTPEGRVWKQLTTALVLFSVFYLFARYSYTAEENEFNKRVFGYYSVIHARDVNKW